MVLNSVLLNLKSKSYINFITPSILLVQYNNIDKLDDDCQVRYMFLLKKIRDDSLNLSELVDYIALILRLSQNDCYVGYSLSKILAFISFIDEGNFKVIEVDKFHLYDDLSPLKGYEEELIDFHKGFSKRR